MFEPKKKHKIMDLDQLIISRSLLKFRLFIFVSLKLI